MVEICRSRMKSGCLELEWVGVRGTWLHLCVALPCIVMSLILEDRGWVVLHPKLSRDSLSSQWPCYGLWGFGEFRYSVPSVPFIIMFIPFTHPSLNSVPPHVSSVWTSLCFMFPFYFAFSFPLFYFLIPKPWPWYMPDPRYPDMPSPDINTFQTSCMFPSLKSTLIVPRTPCPNLQTSVCLLSEIQGQ